MAAKKRKSSPAVGKIAGKFVKSVGKPKIYKALSGEGSKEIRSAINAIGKKAIVLKAAIKVKRKKKA